MKNYCTYFDINYLDRALALHETMEQYCQPYHLWSLVLCDRAEAAMTELALPNVSIVPMRDFETDELNAAKNDRTRTEWIWTCTPLWMQWMFAHTDVDHVAYIDADCFFFNSPHTYTEVDSAEVTITSHNFSPERRWMAASAGRYNVGLVYARRTETGQACLADWAGRCLDRCKTDEGGDQKYWDELLPAYNGLAIEHKGMSLAPWNQSGQYAYSLRDGKIYVDDDPLIFYHFHKRLDPGGFTMDPFVMKYVYPPYAEALARVERRIQNLKC